MSCSVVVVVVGVAVVVVAIVGSIIRLLGCNVGEPRALQLSILLSQVSYGNVLCAAGRRHLGVLISSVGVLALLCGSVVIIVVAVVVAIDVVAVAAIGVVAVTIA